MRWTEGGTDTFYEHHSWFSSKAACSAVRFEAMSAAISFVSLMNASRTLDGLGAKDWDWDQGPEQEYAANPPSCA